MMMIDLRSDTVTKPTAEMLQAMMQAHVGDDVYGEDTTVNLLQRKVADMFGMEEALFCPSGTMTNQIAIKVHTQPGDELICADNAHVYKYEGGGIAFNSSVQAKPLACELGKIVPAQIASAVNANDPHFPISRLVCIENTINRGGGAIYTLREMQQLSAEARKLGLKIHLDGARIFNALVEEGCKASDVGLLFDSVSVCLSKGLGAPVGSLLLGSKSFIAQAKRVRKIFGGGMRQAGYLAAAGIYAIHHNIERLKQDHLKAKEIDKLLKSVTWVKSVLPVQTNIIIFSCQSNLIADKLMLHLEQHQVKANKVAADAIRFVFHLDVSDDDFDRLLKVLVGFEV